MQNRQIHRNKKIIIYLEGKEGGIGVKANGHEVLFGVHESVPESVVMTAKLCKCTKNH